MQDPTTIPRPLRGPASQRGLGLLILLVAAGVLAVVMVGNVFVRRSAEQDRADATRVALAKAKEALIAYAIGRMDDTNAGVQDMPGRLPCPAIWPPTGSNPEGSTKPTCGTVNQTEIGQLPWRTLGIPAPRDGSGECLWYAVSGRFKNAPRGNEIFNWDTEGQIRVLRADGSVAADKVAAVIIAPGPVLNQTRAAAAGAVTCPGSYTATDYVEADHGASNHTMATNASSTEPATSVLIDGGIDPATGLEVVNDRIATITTAELAAAAQRRTDFGVRRVSTNGFQARLTYAVARCLARYAESVDPSHGDHRLPWAGDRVQTLNPLTNSGANVDILSTDGLLAGRPPSRHPTGFDPAPFDGFGEPTGNYFGYANCTSDLDPIRVWWDQWRDHLYYAVSPNFTPDKPKAVTLCSPTGTAGCLKVNSSAAKYVAVVIFAGRRVAGQSRPQWSADTPAPLAARETYANYLEGINLDNIAAAPMTSAPPDPAGTGYTYRSDATVTTTQDDFAYCVELINVGVPPAVSVTTLVNPCPAP